MGKLDTVACIRGSGTAYTEDKQITELRSQPNFGLDFCLPPYLGYSAESPVLRVGYQTMAAPDLRMSTGI
jgi:hypothetical protein